MPYQKSSKARREARPSVCDENILPGLRAAGSHGFRPRKVDDPPPECGGSADGASPASEGSGDVANRVWISTASYPDRAGRMARESQAGLPPVSGGRIGHEEGVPQAAQGLPEARATASGRGKERVLEHGFHVG